MVCEICQSPDVAVVAWFPGDSEMVRVLLCAPCDRRNRPDAFPPTPPAYVHPDSNGAFISWD